MISAATWRLGGRRRPLHLSEREHQICEALAPALRAEGLFFVGIDVIDGMLSEINVTSPTGIREVERLMEQPLADQVIERLQRIYCSVAQQWLVVHRKLRWQRVGAWSCSVGKSGFVRSFGIAVDRSGQSA